MDRSDNYALPNAQEILHILTKESQRHAIRLDYVTSHPEVFNGIRKLTDYAHMSNNWIDGYQKMSLDQLVSELEDSFRKIKAYILSNQGLRMLFDELYDRLSPQRTPEKADVIFVFGSPSNVRIHKAVELYKGGYASRIVISGRGPHYKNLKISEAERMASVAVNAGVPPAIITIEPLAITIPDNVKRTLDLWEISGERPMKLIFIASSFVLRRAYMDWYKYTPWEIELIPVAAPNVDPVYSRDSWHKSMNGIALILNEYAKMIFETKVDYLKASKEV